MRVKQFSFAPRREHETIFFLEDSPTRRFFVRKLLYWRYLCERMRKDFPMPSSVRFFEPISGTAILVSILLSAASFGLNLLVGALTFVPALALGPVVEHLQMLG